MTGARNSGSTKNGTSCIARISAEASVLPVSSNTRNDMAMPPTAPSALAAVTRVKFFVHRVFFNLLTSHICYHEVKI